MNNGIESMTTVSTMYLSNYHIKKFEIKKRFSVIKINDENKTKGGLTPFRHHKQDLIN